MDKKFSLPLMKENKKSTCTHTESVANERSPQKSIHASKRRTIEIKRRSATFAAKYAFADRSFFLTY